MIPPDQDFKNCRLSNHLGKGEDDVLSTAVLLTLSDSSENAGTAIKGARENEKAQQHF